MLGKVQDAGGMTRRGGWNGDVGSPAAGAVNQDLFLESLGPVQQSPRYHSGLYVSEGICGKEYFFQRLLRNVVNCGRRKFVASA